MTYASDVTGTRAHRVGYYIAIAGITERLATHDMTDHGLSGTYLPVIVRDSVRGSMQRLDKMRHIVTPGTLGFSVFEHPTYVDQLQDILRRRGGTETTLASEISATGAAITLGSGTNTYADGTVIHIDREAITLGSHVAAGAYSGCTRGANGTDPIAHRAGAKISDAPRHWLDRKVTLYGVNLDTGTESALRSGVISSPLRFTNGVYPIQATDLMTHFNRTCLSGWQTTRVEKIEYVALAVGGNNVAGMRFYLADPRQLVDDAFVAIEVNGRRGVYYVESGHLDTSTGYIGIACGWGGSAWVGGDLITAADLGFESPNQNASFVDVTLRQIGRYSDWPMFVALQAMTSRAGDSENGTFDILAGRAVDFDSGGDLVEKRVGAGLPETWIESDVGDAGSWNVAIPSIAGKVTGFIDKPVRLIDFLTDEILWRAGGFAYVDGSGVFKFQRYEPRTTRSTLSSLGKDVIGEVVDTWDAEDEIPGKALIKGNYDVASGEFLRTVEVTWEDTAGIYREHGKDRSLLEIESKSLVIGGETSLPPATLGAAAPVHPVALMMMLDRMRMWSLNAGRRHRLRLPWSESTNVVIGATLSLTDDRVPDLEGGSGVTARPVIVTGVDQKYSEGYLEAEVEELPTGVQWAPSAYVSSFSTVTITLDTTGPEASMHDGSPGLDFPDGAQIRIYDASASPPYTSSFTATIASTTATTIVLTGAPGTPPAAGDRITIEDGIPGDTGNTNAAGADVEDFAFAADSSYEVGSGDRAGPKWG